MPLDRTIPDDQAMESISSVLYKLYRGTPKHGEWVVACLKGTWTNILGERLAKTCRPSSVEEKELSVEILDLAWKDALQGMREEIENKLRAATNGEVRCVRFTHPRP